LLDVFAEHIRNLHQTVLLWTLCSPDHVQIVITGGQPLFFAQRDGPWFPTLRLLHQYPQMMVGCTVIVNAGAQLWLAAIHIWFCHMHVDQTLQHRAAIIPAE
jgi:predicted ribosome-associated RNA-binding protein Tma20